MGSYAFANDAQQYSGDWTWTPNSTWVNDFRLGYVYYRNVTVHWRRQPASVESLAERLWHEYGRDESACMAGFPTSRFTSFSGGLGGGRPDQSRRGPEGDVDLVESVSYLRGKHAFKFGFEYLDIVFDGDSPTAGLKARSTSRHLQNFPRRASRQSGSILLGDPTQTRRGATGTGGSFRMIGASAPESP